jgi:hypothetical protein
MSGRPSRRLILAFALACAPPARAAAASVLAVLSSDSDHYRQAYEGFQEEWGSSVPFILAGGAVRGTAPDALVAFGSRAALKDWPSSTLLVTCLAPGVRPKHHHGEVLRVVLLPSPPQLVDAFKKLLPSLQSLRVLWSSETQSEDVADLADAARAKGLFVVSERIEDPRDLPARVRAFGGRADALWLMPDPTLVNAENFATLREYSAAARVPFLAPSEGLAEQGATATLAVSFRDLGRQAAAALKARLRGETVGEYVHSDRIVVTVNEAAARETGVDLSAATGVDRTIR